MSEPSLDDPTPDRSPEVRPDTSDPAIDALGFEAALRRLEETVLQLEKPDLSLDQAVGLYEEGAALATRCQSLLEAAEARLRRVDAAGREVGDVNL